jgi:TPR repeat protein
MGVGTNRDELGAHVWYVRAADHGDERAKARLTAIEAAMQRGINNLSKGTKKTAKSNQPGEKDGENCIVM